MTVKEIIGTDVMFIIPFGSVVTVKNDPENTPYIIKSVEIRPYAKWYRLSKNAVSSESWVHEDEIIYNKPGIVRVETDKASKGNKEDTMSKLELLVNDNNIMLKDLKIGLYNSVCRQWWTADQKSVEHGIDIEISALRVSSYGYINNKLVLANDIMLRIYRKGTGLAFDELFDTVTRIVKLKPFYKRIFPTLLYGRNHPKNFSMMETDHDYAARLNQFLLDKMDLSSVYFKREQFVL